MKVEDLLRCIDNVNTTPVEVTDIKTGTVHTAYPSCSNDMVLVAKKIITKLSCIDLFFEVYQDNYMYISNFELDLTIRITEQNVSFMLLIENPGNLNIIHNYTTSLQDFLLTFENQS